MKLRFISSALAAALFAATGSYAAVVDGGTIHFEGELVNAACSVNTDSADQVVTLGQYRTDIFNAVGNTSALIPFTIQLNDCDPVVAANAAVAFSGQLMQSMIIYWPLHPVPIQQQQRVSVLKYLIIHPQFSNLMGIASQPTRT